MHFLPGSLILALLFSLPVHSAVDTRAKQLVGVWKGTAVTSPGSCAWDVEGKALDKISYLTGSFSYSGPCSAEVYKGTFNAARSGKDCLLVNVNIQGMPKMQFPSCFDEKGDLVFNSMLFSGSMKFSEEGRKADLAAKALVGSAVGSFRKQLKSSAGKAGEKGKINVKPLKARPLEVYGGSN